MQALKQVVDGQKFNEKDKPRDLEAKFDVNPDLPPEQRQLLLKLLHEFKDVFAFSVHDIKKANFVETSFVPIDAHEIIRGRPFRFSPQDKADATEYLRELQAYGLVEESHAPHENAVFFIKKPNSTGKRCLLDMRALNSTLMPYSYPITLQDQYLDSFVGSKYFCSLDLRSGYWNIPLHPDSRDWTSFTIPDLGKFRFTRIVQGCSTSAAYFAESLNYLHLLFHIFW